MITVAVTESVRPHLSGTTSEGCNIIQVTYAFQERRLFVGPLIGILYQETIIGCAVRDAISASHTRVEQARMLLNYLECQPASLLFKYVEILEESAQSDGLTCHAEIARELRKLLPHKENSERSENCNLQVESNHDDNDVRRHSRTLKPSAIGERATPVVHCTPPSDSMHFQLNPSVEHHTPPGTDFNLSYPDPPPLISVDSDDSSSDHVVSLTEVNRLTVNNITRHPPEAVRRAQLPDSNHHQVMPQLTAPDVVCGHGWSNRRQCIGYHRHTHLDRICHLDELSSSSEVDDLSSGSEGEDDETTMESNSVSHDCPHELAFLFNRKRHMKLLKANAHQREFKKLWKVYIKDIEGAKQCVKYILRDPTNSLDYCISMTMAGRDYSPHSISIIERALKKTLKKNCLNPEIFQCRLHCHLVDCYLNSENYSEALKQVKIALQLAEVIMSDVSSAWAWCMYAWLLYWEYSDVIDDLPFTVENEIEDALSKAVDYSNRCPELHWLAETVKLGKAHWHFEMVDNYRHIWNDYNGGLAHLGVGRKALQNVHTGLLNTFGMGYYYTLWCRYFQLSGRMQAASVSAREAVQYYLKVKRYQHALVVAGDIAADNSLVAYIQKQMKT